MTLSRIVYRLGLLDPRIEIFSILGWMLFFPKGDSKSSAYIFFLVMAGLVVLFSLRNLFFLKNFIISFFSLFLALFNLALIFSSFFSVYPFRSLYAYADIFLVSFYFALVFLDQKDNGELCRGLALMFSLFSTVILLNRIFPFIQGPGLFFSNTILEGIVSGIGALILLHSVLKKFTWPHLLLLAINGLAVYFSQSKAAFIGLAIFSLFLLAARKRALILIPLGLAIVTFAVPNPIKTAFQFSLKKDPYAFDRIFIWKVALDVFRANLLTGVGPDNFAEVSQKYNFRQTKGLAQYAKVPRQTHNDYLKVIAETGIPGLILLCLLLFLLARKIISSPVFDLKKILILYLLFQALFFNILFHPFFFALFLLLCKMLFEEKPAFKSLSYPARCGYFLVLILFWTGSYILPLLANQSIGKAQQAKDPASALNLLTRAAFYNPLDIDPYRSQARIFFAYFEETSHLDHFYAAIDNLKKVQRRNPWFVDAYLQESGLYYTLMQKNLQYPALKEEILSPLAKAERIDPFNPFIKMHQAQVYLEFGQAESAKKKAGQAIELEPNYISALYFLQRNFQYFGSETAFKDRIQKILIRIRGMTLVPGTYLFELFQVPPELKAETKNL